MSRILGAFFLGVLGAISLQGWASEVLYVKVDKDLMSQAQKDSEMVGRLKGGDRVEVLKESMGWFQVRTGKGTVGWAPHESFDSKKTAVKVDVPTGRTSVVRTTLTLESLVAANNAKDSNPQERIRAQGYRVSRDEGVRFGRDGKLKPVDLPLPN